MPLLADLYYYVKPCIPRAAQVAMRRRLARRVARRSAARWPILDSTAKPPENWQGWPDGKGFAVVLTHDVETSVGHERCREVMELERELGFRSVFNFVPERYAVSAALREELVHEGFEVGVHGLNHDGHLFASRSVFDRRAPKINKYLAEWGAKGFRAPSMRSHLEWIGELDIAYDASTFDTDPFEPNPDGAGTVFPFLVDNEARGTTYVELPYTMPQDFTLFVLLEHRDIRIWEEKLDWLWQRGGMVLVNTHPDYMTPEGSAASGGEYPIALYRRLLEVIRERYAGRYWHVLPRELAEHWRTRADDESHARHLTRPRSRKIWIDLDNTPHVPFFKPIIAELNRRGHDTIVTARDAFQVCALAEKMDLPCRQIGRHYGKNRLMKVFGLAVRSGQLLPVALREKPDLAVSHGARSQVIAANALRIPSVVITDYEYARMPACMRPRWQIVPEVIPSDNLHCAADHVLKYAGIKEDVYVAGFRPDPVILEDLRIPADTIVVTVRPPATEAHYHNPDSEGLFTEAMERLCGHPDTFIVLLPRNNKQEAWIRERWPQWFADGKTIVPDHAIDGLNLLYHSDLAISGGGTMNREAVALKVPVYSIFRGTIGAVDLYLETQGSLVLLTCVQEVREKVRIEKRKRDALPDPESLPALRNIVDHIESLLSGKARESGDA
jgi:uncharacterized protein